MNTAIPPEIKGELDEIKHNVQSLKATVEKLVERLDKQMLSTDDVTPNELLRQAVRVFEVSSDYSPDDDNIAPDAVLKPVDWSSYAQNRES
jgi:hypothetical protein